MAILGAGLIGTSVGLALRQRGVDVEISDRDPSRAQLAVSLGAGRVGVELARDQPADLVLLCVPPEAIAPELVRAQKHALGLTYSDVASIKAQPQVNAEEMGADMTAFIGGHPIAGRERSGPGSARADLFLGRPWVLTPTPMTSAAALAMARELVILCGAEPLTMTPAEHDAAMAVVSHLPQTVASLLASNLTRSVVLPAVAGQGFDDMTRIADSDPILWSQIAAGNAGPLSAALRESAAQLAQLAETLSTGTSAQGAAAFAALVNAGKAGRDLLPGKHGGRRERYAVVAVVIRDEPGALARMLADAGAAEINVEDLTLEHSPDAPVGICELLVDPGEEERLRRALAMQGWDVHGRRQG